VLTDLMSDVVHRIESRDTLDLCVAAFEPEGDLGKGLTGQVAAVLALGNPEGRKNEGFEVGIVGLKGFQLGNRLGAEFQHYVFRFGRGRPVMPATKLKQFAHGREVYRTTEPMQAVPQT
jgi:hypothetical protein